ncbi:hypothetical protein JW998_16115 [candidate division KSB1 bacterium]|nr:hypothetical protein [candidate division KSB1 bacterium]
MNKILIDLGCGQAPAPGYIGLDIKRTSKAAVIGRLPHLPFKNESVHGFRARHVLEHFFSEEIFAILRAASSCLVQDGEFIIIVPHGTNPAAAQLDHKSYWSYNSPLTIVKDGLHDEWIGGKFKLECRKLYWMRQDYQGRFPWLVKWMNWMINKRPVVMERLSYYFGGIYEMEFKIRKIG